jgi:hypothetical protein
MRLSKRPNPTWADLFETAVALDPLAVLGMTRSVGRVFDTRWQEYWCHPSAARDLCSWPARSLAALEMTRVGFQVEPTCSKLPPCPKPPKLSLG